MLAFLTQYETETKIDHLPIAGQTFKRKMLFSLSFFLSKHLIRLPKSPSHLNS